MSHSQSIIQLNVNQYLRFSLDLNYKLFFATSSSFQDKINPEICKVGQQE